MVNESFQSPLCTWERMRSLALWLPVYVLLFKIKTEYKHFFLEINHLISQNFITNKYLPYRHDHITLADENLLRASYKVPSLLGQHTELH